MAFPFDLLSDEEEQVCAQFGVMKMKNMFPEWPRAISEFLMNYIKRDYYKEVGKFLSESDIEKRTELKKEELKTILLIRIKLLSLENWNSTAWLSIHK